jgi:hypothetical protein
MGLSLWLGSFFTLGFCAHASNVKIKKLTKKNILIIPVIPKLYNETGTKIVFILKTKRFAY